MSTAHATLVLLALAACAMAPAAAQDAAAFASGARVRLSVRPFATPLVGSLVRLGRDSVWLSTSQRGSSRAGAMIGIPLEALTRVELSRGQRSRGSAAARRGGVGLLIGGTLGAALGAAVYDPNTGSLDRGGSMLAGGAALGAVSALAGALHGLAAPGERWQRLPLPLRISLAPRPRGAAPERSLLEWMPDRGGVVTEGGVEPKWK